MKFDTLLSSTLTLIQCLQAGLVEEIIGDTMDSLDVREVAFMHSF